MPFWKKDKDSGKAKEKVNYKSRLEHKQYLVSISYLFCCLNFSCYQGSRVSWTNLWSCGLWSQDSSHGSLLEVQGSEEGGSASPGIWLLWVRNVRIDKSGCRTMSWSLWVMGRAPPQINCPLSTLWMFTTIHLRNYPRTLELCTTWK